MSNYQFTIGHDDGGKKVVMDLPTLIETRMFDLASSGGGKSYALRVLIERTAEHVQWLVLDPEGEFNTLRSKFDFLLVGDGGEIPVDARSAKLLARKIMETRASVIIDLYGLGKLGIDWTSQFLPELMALPKNLWSPVMVGIDEAHKFARESTKGKETEPPAITRKAVITLSDSGRKQARGCVIATQRITKLAADARAELRNNLIGLTVQDLDRERAADILGISKSQSMILRELQAGQFYAFGPAFVSHKGVFLLQVDQALTTHPKPGQGKLAAVPKASEAVKDLLEKMGDVPSLAQAEVDALTGARQEIITLRRQLTVVESELRARPTLSVNAEPVAQTPPEIIYVDKPILDDDERNLYWILNKLQDAAQPLLEMNDLLKELPAFSDPLRLMVMKVSEFEGTQAQKLEAATARATREFVRTQNPGKHEYRTNTTRAERKPIATLAPKSTRAARANGHTAYTNSKLPEGELKILTVCAQFLNGATRKQLTVLTGYKRSTRDTYIARLSAKELVYQQGQQILPTGAGIAELGPNFEPLPMGEALQEYWLDNLPAGERVIFQEALKVFPDWLDKETLDTTTDFKRSTRDTYIARMANRQVIDTRPGAIRASEELF